jgi:hypothetical protein
VVNKLRDHLLGFFDLSQLDPTPAQCVYKIDSKEIAAPAGSRQKKGETATYDR